MTLSVSEWAAKVRAGEVRAISRAITAIENITLPKPRNCCGKLFLRRGRLT